MPNTSKKRKTKPQTKATSKKALAKTPSKKTLTKASSKKTRVKAPSKKTLTKASSKKTAAKTSSKKAPTKSRQKSASSTKTKNVVRQQHDVIPGQLFLGKEDIVAFEGRQIIEISVANTGDRPIQVGSHCHFFEANRALRFNREKAFGFRLSVPAGTAVRFEPGEKKHVTLVSIGGNRVAYGINGLTEGSLDDAAVKARALSRAAEQGFLHND